jgi:hypothetical protein
MLYRCFIRGENFPGELVGKRGSYGFYTARWIEATSAEEAERACLELLKGDPTFQVTSPKLLEKAVDAKVYFEKIEPVRPTKRKRVNSGATWFKMD